MAGVNFNQLYIRAVIGTLLSNGCRYRQDIPDPLNKNFFHIYMLEIQALGEGKELQL